MGSSVLWVYDDPRLAGEWIVGPERSPVQEGNSWLFTAVGRDAARPLTAHQHES